MTKMNFENKALERFYRSFKWARNNSLQLWDVVRGENMSGYQPQGSGQHSALYQFQCLITTTDTYYRKLTAHKDARFGVLIDGQRVVTKEDVPSDTITKILKQQIIDLEDLLRNFNDADFQERIQDIQSIINHEYLHQGQLVIMFRENNTTLPDRFKKAFDL